MRICSIAGQPRRSAAERAEFHRLLAQTIYRAESDYTLHNARNVGAIVTHFEKALRLGIALAASDWTGLGDAYRWSQRDESAVEAYRRALEGRPAKADRVRRQLVEMQLARGDNRS
jgi:cytochrome c-type biogenesis protein CcmH/NrfG